jgi:hypothetical protein
MRRSLRCALWLLSWSAPAAAQETVHVRAAPRAPREATTTQVSAEQARSVPGTQNDPLKVVEALPGVARPAMASGALVVWGAAPSETRVYVDGVEVPALYHGSALRSVLNADLVSGITLVPGAFGADYGRSLGGLVKVETRALRKDGVQGSAGADLLDTSGSVSAALGERARIAVAARQSYLDALVAATSIRDASDVFPIPRYRDYQAKGTFDLRENETLDVVFLGSHDARERAVPSLDPAKRRSDEANSGFHRLYLRYRSNRDAEAVELAPFVGEDRSTLRTSYGANPTELTVNARRYGVRASYRMRMARVGALSLGFDAAGTASDVARTGSLTLPAREGDITVFGQAPSDETTTDDYSTHILNAAPWASAEFRLGRLTVTPGARVEAFLIEENKAVRRVGDAPPIGLSRLEGAVDPRLAVRYQAAPPLVLNAAAGVYHQAPEPQDLSAVFGTPALAPSRALHGSVGEELRILPDLSLGATVFYKTMSDLEVRSRLTTPVASRALVQNGEGRSYGIQFLLRRDFKRGLFGWVSYTIARSERRYIGDERYRLFDFDQPHVLTLVVSQEIGRWTLGARFRYASGMPRTPVIGSYYDARQDTYQPLFGQQNAIRISPFYQLDLKVERRFPLSEDVRLVAFVDAQNVTFHENAEDIAYSADYRQKGIIRGLPALAIAGARVEF